MTIDIRPLLDRIVVERVKAKEKTESGIIIPDTAQERAQEAIVLAVGPGKRDEYATVWPPNVHVGEIVLLGKFSGAEVEIDGRKVWVVREEDILGVREKRTRAAESI